jgi:hypothetical protein
MKNVIFPKIGWSPDDVEYLLKTEFCDLETNKLDYVFIDGGHWYEAIERDLLAIEKYIDDNTIVLLHDVFNSIDLNKLDKLINSVFGVCYDIVLKYPNGFNMAKVKERK